MICVLLTWTKKTSLERLVFLCSAGYWPEFTWDEQLVFHQLNSSASFLSADLSEISSFAQVAIVNG